MTSDPFKKFLTQNAPKAPAAPRDELEQILARAQLPENTIEVPATPAKRPFRRVWAGGLVAASFVLSFWGVQLLSPVRTVAPIGIEVAATPIPTMVSDDDLSMFMLEAFGALDGDETNGEYGWGEEFLL